AGHWIGRSLRRHHWYALIARTNFFRGGREIQCCATLVGASASNHQPVGTRHDVALAKRRIVLDLDPRYTDLVLAVAATARGQLVAIAKRIRQFRVRLAGLGQGMIDTAAVDHLGFARRAKAAARRRAALAVRAGDWKIAAIAGANA